MSTKNTEISLKLDFAGKCPKPDRFGYLDEYSDLIWVLFLLPSMFSNDGHSSNFITSCLIVNVSFCNIYIFL